MSPAGAGRSTPVRAVVLDLDGVVRFWDPAIMRNAEAQAGLVRGSLASAVLGDEALLHAAVTGVISDAEWRNRIASHLEVSYGTGAGAAVRAWSSHVGAVVDDVIEIVRATRTWAQVVLLSNATTRLRGDLIELGILEDFDAVYNSAELGIAKPDSAVFRFVCADLGHRPEEVAFVDDTDGHVRAARQIGMPSHRFESAEGLSVFLAPLRPTHGP